MKLVTISGLDGSGKTTQVQLLKNYLESRGQRVFYFHAIEFSIGNKILTNFNVNKNNRPLKSVNRANWLQLQLRKIALRIDLMRFKFLYKKLCNAGYNYILSDRFFYDTIINITYLSLCHSGLDPESSPAIQKHVQNNKYRIIKPDTALYLQTNPEIIMRRERVPDQGFDYLQKKNELYDQSAELFGLKIIDGNKTKEEIFTELKNLCQV